MLRIVLFSDEFMFFLSGGGCVFLTFSFFVLHYLALNRLLVAQKKQASTTYNLPGVLPPTPCT